MSTPNAAAIRQLRVRAGLEPRDLAAASDIPAKTIRNIESTGQDCSDARLHRIAKALGVDVEDLISKDDKKKQCTPTQPARLPKDPKPNKPEPTGPSRPRRAA